MWRLRELWVHIAGRHIGSSVTPILYLSVPHPPRGAEDKVNEGTEALVITRLSEYLKSNSSMWTQNFLG